MSKALITISLTLPEEMLGKVYALLGGTSLETISTASPVKVTPTPAAEASIAVAEASTVEEASSDAPEASDDVTVDAHGHPWSVDLHASTKGTTKDGLWRMKVGVSRPDPMPGFPIAETPSSTSSASTATKDADTVTEPAGSTQTEAPASAASQEVDDADEFAAFREAAAASDAKDAKVEVPARKFTDADLGVLCNQAAVKLGDPGPVREQISKFVPAGETAHSRNIPQDQRPAFVAAVEAAAGIEFVG